MIQLTLVLANMTMHSANARTNNADSEKLHTDRCAETMYEKKSSN